MSAISTTIFNLVGFLLQGTADKARDAIGKLPPGRWELEFAAAVVESKLPGLIYRQVIDLDLRELFCGEIPGKNRSLLSALQLTSIQATAMWDRNDESFCNLCSQLSDLTEGFLWLKGAGVSRTLYNRPQDRYSVDFDILVNSRFHERVFDRLHSIGYSIDWTKSQQYLIGPTGDLKHITIRPSAQLTPFENVTFLSPGAPPIEVKSEPFERNLNPENPEEIFNCAREFSWRNVTFRFPATTDALLVALCHLQKDRFMNWSTLYDAHLLIKAINNSPESWESFCKKSHVEDLAVVVYHALQACQDHLSSPVPERVMQQFRKSRAISVPREIVGRVYPLFVWNKRNAVHLLVNACLLGKTKRKLHILLNCLFPSQAFLSEYYLGGKQASSLGQTLLRVLNLLVLLLPGGLVSRTIGPYLWGTELPTEAHHAGKTQ